MAPKEKKKKIATNIPLDLIMEAVERSGLNQTAAIVEGLKELIRREKIRELVALEGKVEIHYDVDRLRNRN